ncbi:MFS general substrate transporter [Aspergillus alliaceus]|uniref:MFS general substrate transporter n=1 Tax=Petromyces alliaceus TaxID=209559 RepID=A0A5N7C3L8_PETAA|nr:MFS general substrate transporter [Aspergillus alliaceus]
MSEPSLQLEGTLSSVSSQRDEEVQSISREDPRSWSVWKKTIQILMIAFHSMVAAFMAGGIIPEFDAMVKEYNVTVPEASYLTSIQILVIWLAPLFWKPVTRIYGQYHVSLISVLGSIMVTRVLTAILVSPPVGIGSWVITELCEPAERAQKLGWWTLMSTLGIPAGPFIMGLARKRVFISEDSHSAKKGFIGKAIPRRMDPRPLTLGKFIESILLYRYPRVLITTVAQSIVFCYTFTLIVVEMPIAFGKVFHLDAQQIELQYIAVIIGSLFGEQVSRPMSDRFMKSLSMRRGHSRPADRLWLSYIGFATVIAGLLIWGFQLENTTSWDITPCIGVAIVSFGNQILTTVLIAFAVDSYKEHPMDIRVFVNFVRHVYGFLGLFYLSPMLESLNMGEATEIFCAIISVCAFAPMVALQVVASQRRH